jgi:hypothetical protein
MMSPLRSTPASIVSEVDHDALAGDVQPFRRRFHDAQVGLMRDHPGDVVGREVRALEHLQRRLDHLGHRVLEDFATGHVNLIAFVGNAGLRQRFPRAARGQIEHLGRVAVGAEFR